MEFPVAKPKRHQYYLVLLIISIDYINYDGKFIGEIA